MIRRPLLATILLASLLSFLSISQVNAMGDNPSTCPNRYDGVITSLRVTLPHGVRFDPIAHRVVFGLRDDRSYSVTFIIRTPAESSQGNTQSGTTWFDTSAFGFQLGQCVGPGQSYPYGNVGPNQDVTIQVDSIPHPANLAPLITQTVTWSTLVGNSVSYAIHWVP